MTRDEMVDGKGGLRPQWRNLLGVLAAVAVVEFVEEVPQHHPAIGLEVRDDAHDIVLECVLLERIRELIQNVE